MGDKTKIDWADATWNPVTGCFHRCEYCYARKIAKRFGGHWDGECINLSEHTKHEINTPLKKQNGKKAPYPYEFDPTFHWYRLDIPAKLKKPRMIFVCSMADLFGRWVPDEWIEEVFKACKAAPQHRYLFLTKALNRYAALRRKGILPLEKNFWYGVTVTDRWDFAKACEYMEELPTEGNYFLSIEPILDDVANCPEWRDPVIPFYTWVIVGAETGNRKDKVAPLRDWIDRIYLTSAIRGIPVFMKYSLLEMMGMDFCYEFPWEEEE